MSALRKLGRCKKCERQFRLEKFSVIGKIELDCTCPECAEILRNCLAKDREAKQKEQSNEEKRLELEKMKAENEKEIELKKSEMEQRNKLELQRGQHRHEAEMLDKKQRHEAEMADKRIRELELKNDLTVNYLELSSRLNEESDELEESESLLRSRHNNCGPPIQVEEQYNSYW